MRYYIQYAAGTGDLILDALSRFVENVEVRYRDDSAMVFDSSSKMGRVADIPFAKNAFVVIDSTPRGSIDKGVAHLSRSVGTVRFPNLPSGTRSFRVMVHIDGELASVDQRSKVSLERGIAARTGGRVEPRGLCQEYWVVGRLDMSELLLCARLPKAKRAPKAKGAISYELSAMLVAASGPRPDDVFLDPFGGSGSFPLARTELPARQIWYSDTNLRSLRQDFPAELTRDKRVRLLSEDAFKLPTIADGSVDVIVTDPPWGEHEDLGMPYPDFANAVVESFGRVLNPTRGRFVVLVSRRTAPIMSEGLVDGGFAISATHEVLVNGHPASVLIGARGDRPRSEQEPIRSERPAHKANPQPRQARGSRSRVSVRTDRFLNKG